MNGHEAHYIVRLAHHIGKRHILVAVLKEVKEAALKAEEQRILYVALTRARDKLFMTGFIKGFKNSKGVLSTIARSP